MGSDCLMSMGFPFGVKKCSGTRWWWWVYNIVNILSTTELYTLKCLKWSILCYVCFHHNLKKWFNASSIIHGVKSRFLALVYKTLPNFSSPPALPPSSVFSQLPLLPSHPDLGPNPNTGCSPMSHASPRVCLPAASPAQGPPTSSFSREDSPVRLDSTQAQPPWKASLSPSLSLGRVPLVDILIYLPGITIPVLITV